MKYSITNWEGLKLPSSTNRHLANATEAIRTSGAESVLDVGIGCGKWGLLCREYLDVFQGRTKPEEWKARIDGVEAYLPYRTYYPWLDKIYNAILWEPIEKAVHLIDSDSTDLVIAGDVIEHLTKTDAINVLGALSWIARKRMILSIPIGTDWLNNVVPNENKLEKHQSVWEPNEVISAVMPAFAKNTTEMVFEPKGPIGLFIFDK